LCKEYNTMPTFIVRGIVADPQAFGLTPPLQQTSAVEPAAWEQIETGRYMPRRIRGSYRGRELG
jgi:hypothetical protein